MDMVSSLISVGPPRKDRFDQMPNLFPAETSGSGMATNGQAGQQANGTQNAAAILEQLRKFREQEELKRAQEAMKTPQSDPNQSPWLMMA